MNVFQVCRIHFIYPSGKEPLENVSKGKEKLARRLDKLPVYGILSGPMRFLFLLPVQAVSNGSRLPMWTRNTSPCPMASCDMQQCLTKLLSKPVVFFQPRKAFIAILCCSFNVKIPSNFNERAFTLISSASARLTGAFCISSGVFWGSLQQFLSAFVTTRRVLISYWKPKDQSKVLEIRSWEYGCARFITWNFKQLKHRNHTAQMKNSFWVLQHRQQDRRKDKHRRTHPEPNLSAALCDGWRH